MANPVIESRKFTDDASKQVWEKIAEELSQKKQDPVYMVQLWRELDRAMLEATRPRKSSKAGRSKKKAA